MTELDQLKEERDILVSGEHSRTAAHERTEVPTGRPGAPLWLLCDFADGLNSASQAGLEAALEASGLLHAWVTPSGELLNPEKHDAVFVAGNHSVAARRRSPRNDVSALY